MKTKTRLMIKGSPGALEILRTLDRLYEKGVFRDFVSDGRRSSRLHCHVDPDDQKWAIILEKTSDDQKWHGSELLKMGNIFGEEKFQLATSAEKSTDLPEILTVENWIIQDAAKPGNDPRWQMISNVMEYGDKGMYVL